MNTKSFISELVRQPNNEQVVFLSDYDMTFLLELICSFLNGEGGWIIVGHDGKKFLGLKVLSDKVLEELKENINERIFPLPLVYLQRERYEEDDVLLINVLKGSRQPYSLDRKYYVKTGNTPKLASPDDISLLLRSSDKHTSTWEKLTAIDATLDNINQDEVRLTIDETNKLSRGNKLPETPADFLNYFQLLDFNLLKNGALVLFGINPQRFLPQCRIRITVLPEGKTGTRFGDTLLIEANLFESFDRVRDYFRKNLPVISEFRNDNWNRISREKFPTDALDEAIVNAMVHRDYGDFSGEITINIYNDIIEIINSGEIPPDILKGKSTIEAHHSVLRNPIIAHMFYLRGKMEKLGRGLSLIKERFAQIGLQTPEWSTQSGYTKLTLFGKPKSIEVNERMEEFLGYLSFDEEFNREFYLQHFKNNIKERTAREDLKKMMDGGWILKVGDGPTTKYRRTNKIMPDNAG